MPDAMAMTTGTNEIEIIYPEPQTIEIGVVGPPGAIGPAGGGGFAYVHDQIVPSAVWVINHNLNGFLNATVIDSAGDVVFGNVTYNDANTMTISFSGSFSGKAYLS